jgi:phosphoribosylformylglycinamidine synthase
VARVVVDVMLKPEILDPQGQAVANALPRLGVSEVSSVRIGKRIELEFDGAVDLDRAREIADKLLANPVIEDFSLRVEDHNSGAGDGNRIAGGGGTPGGDGEDVR